MPSVVRKIQELKTVARFSKHDQLVNGIINAIDEKIVNRGETLPSVNLMVEELGFARKTIVKAYTDLKERGIVESRNRLGYFVANDSTDQKIKVALVLYAFHSFQEQFYNTFRRELGDNVQIEIFFHHNNFQVFDSIMKTIAQQYGMYVIAPMKDKRCKEILETIPANKLLIVDRYVKLGAGYSYVSQRFKRPFYAVLKSLHDRLSDFESCVLFYTENKDHPSGIRRGFEMYCSEYGVQHEVRAEYQPNTIKKGTVYLTINDNDLWEILRDSKEQGIALGQDIGILSQNDNTIKQIISGGISTFSTDFITMAKKAANCIIHRQPIQEIIPSKLIRRASL